MKWTPLVILPPWPALQQLRTTPFIALRINRAGMQFMSGSSFGAARLQEGAIKIEIESQFIWSLAINGKENRFSLHATKKMVHPTDVAANKKALWDKDSDQTTSAHQCKLDPEIRILVKAVLRHHNRETDEISAVDSSVWYEEIPPSSTRNGVYSNGTDNNAFSREDNKNSQKKNQPKKTTTKKKNTQSP